MRTFQEYIDSKKNEALGDLWGTMKQGASALGQTASGAWQGAKQGWQNATGQGQAGQPQQQIIGGVNVTGWAPEDQERLKANQERIRVAQQRIRAAQQRTSAAQERIRAAQDDTGET